MKTKDTPKQYVIYSRKSKFTGKGESIENQIELCRQYIAMHFGEGSGGKRAGLRGRGLFRRQSGAPAVQEKMMKDSQKIAFAAIVVYRLDRISRNIGDFAKLIEDLGDRHIDFISIREQFDTSSPMGRAMMYIASVFSQLERETIAERIRDNMHELSKTGRWLGGINTHGLRLGKPVQRDGGRQGEEGLQAQTHSGGNPAGQDDLRGSWKPALSKTDQYLLEHRCVTKRGKQFTRFAIRGILTNPVYMIADETAYQYLKENNVDLFAERSEFDGEHGIMAYNRTLQRLGKANQIRPMGEWIVAVGKHPGIIAGSDWVRVQAMLDVNKSKSYRRPRSNVALLSGLLRCGECGDYMRPKLTNRRTADGELIYTYMCSTKERSHGTVCSMKNCNGNTLDAKIIEGDPQALRRQGRPYPAAGADQEGYQRQQGGLRRRAGAAPGKHTETEDRIKRLVESLSVASDTSAKYVMEQIDELHRESETQQARLFRVGSPHRAEPDAPSGVRLPSGDDRILRQRGGFCHAGGKRRLLRTIVKRWSGDGKNAYVYLFAGGWRGGFAAH